MHSRQDPDSTRLGSAPIEVVKGTDAVGDGALISRLADLWADAYRASPVAAQSHDPLYASEKSRGLGKALTRCLCSAFDGLGFEEAVARTINPLALDKVYLPLGFKVHTRFRDPGSRAAERFIFGSSLPLASQD
jgi:hypothetical protein